MAPPMWIGHDDACRIARELSDAAVKLRRAVRWLTKAESAGGVAAHRDVHEAETAISKALTLIGGDR